MALRDEIVPYVDGNGLVAPNTVGPNPGRGSDNGPMYTSEYYVMLFNLFQLVGSDINQFNLLIGSCIDPNGLLNRAPNDSDQEGPDDYYGVLNGCKTLGNTDIPRKFLWAVVKYLGFLNNNQPGKKTLSSFLIRQPQLLACMVAAAFPSWKNPLHFVCRLAAFPFFLVAAVSIGISCISTQTGDTDSRRLAWHVQNTTKGVSLLCWVAAQIWLRRLYKDYPNGMKGVATIYYQAGHPFAKYWIT